MPFSADERRLIGALVSGLRPFADARDDLQLSYVIALLLVAEDEGQTAAHYARLLGGHRTKGFRKLRGLSDRNPNGTAGLGTPISKSYSFVRQLWLKALVAPLLFGSPSETIQI